MEKTIEQILDTCAAEMQPARDAIGKIVSDSKAEGVEWPELEEEPEHGPDVAAGPARASGSRG